MRTFRLIGMALLAIIISVNLTACSNDDELDSNKNQKNITQIIELYNSGEKRITAFEYDTDANLIGLDEGGELYEKITYSDNQITITIHDIGNVGKTWTNEYYLNAGRVIQSKDESGNICTYEYDENNQLIEQVEKSQYGTEVIKYTWDNGNIIKSEYLGDDEYTSIIYTYTDIPSTKGFSLVGQGLGRWSENYYTAEILYKKGYFGVYPKNLVSTYIAYDSSNNEEVHLELKYSFDNEGYASGIKIENLLDKESEENSTVKVIWE